MYVPLLHKHFLHCGAGNIYAINLSKTYLKVFLFNEICFINKFSPQETFGNIVDFGNFALKLWKFVKLNKNKNCKFGDLWKNVGFDKTLMYRKTTRRSSCSTTTSSRAAAAPAIAAIPIHSWSPRSSHVLQSSNIFPCKGMKRHFPLCFIMARSSMIFFCPTSTNTSTTASAKYQSLGF